MAFFKTFGNCKANLTKRTFPLIPLPPCYHTHLFFPSSPFFPSVGNRHRRRQRPGACFAREDFFPPSFVHCIQGRFCSSWKQDSRGTSRISRPFHVLCTYNGLPGEKCTVNKVHSVKGHRNRQGGQINFSFLCRPTNCPTRRPSIPHSYVLIIPRPTKRFFSCLGG